MVVRFKVVGVIELDEDFHWKFSEQYIKNKLSDQIAWKSLFVEQEGLEH